MNFLKIISVFLAVAVLQPMFSLFSFAEEATGISAESAVLILADTGEVIISRAPNKRMPMASTTKIMTAISVIENFDIARTLTIPKEAEGVEGSSAYLRAGERYTVTELLYALMLSSANDAAVALAVGCGGSIEDFAEIMNDKACDLGLSDTHFSNPHGLDAKEHYSTAYDLALIMAYAMKNETFRTVTASGSYTCSSKGNESKVFYNHNKLLDRYQWCTGGKTGFTKLCGRCLVSSAEKDGVELICVTLNASDDWNDHEKMFEAGFERYQRIELVSEDGILYSLPTVNGEKERVKAFAKPCDAVIERDDSRYIKTVTELERFYYADIKKGQRLGSIVFYQGEKEIARSDIIATEEVKELKYKNFFWRILSVFK